MPPEDVCPLPSMRAICGVEEAKKKQNDLKLHVHLLPRHYMLRAQVLPTQGDCSKKKNLY